MDHEKIISAYLNGQTIEFKFKSSKEWETKSAFNGTIIFDFNDLDYQIAPTTHTLTFTQEEVNMIADMCGHIGGCPIDTYRKISDDILRAVGPVTTRTHSFVDGISIGRSRV